jgi:carbamate kinase
MRIVVALGGNALLRRGQPMTVENQRTNVAVACEQLAPLALEHELVISHGNGPQVGLLALSGAAYKEVPTYPLDVLGAESQGMIGYLLELELANRLPADHPVMALLTMIEVDPEDPAFDDPTKPIGPIYQPDEVGALEAERGWTFRPDGDHMRRVVASPAPKHIYGIAQVDALLDGGCAVICAGGGGIPVARDTNARLYGVEAVIDKDHASARLARQLEADLFVMATDADAAYVGWGTPQQEPILKADPEQLLKEHGAEFAAGSMLPKVIAACDFARLSGHRSVIGQLGDIEALVAGTAGTNITNQEG